MRPFRGTPPDPRGLSLRPDDGRRETEGDVLAALVDGLIAEDLFGFRSRARIGSVAGALYLPLTGDERHVQVGLGPDARELHQPSPGCALVFRARPAAALQPYRLSRPPVLLLGPESVGPVPLTPRDLLDLVVARLADARPPNLDDVLDGLELAVTHGATLLEAEATWGRVRSAARPTLLDWEALTAVGDRPFHPTGRARVGWDQARHRRYSPGGEQPVALDWVAVRRDHLDCGTFDRLAEAVALARVDRGSPEASRRETNEALPGRPLSPAEALLAAEDRVTLEAAMAAADPDELSRAGVATRLRYLLDRCGTGADRRRVTATSVASRIEAATTDEIFAFIDNELGRRSG